MSSRDEQRRDDARRRLAARRGETAGNQRNSAAFGDDSPSRPRSGNTGRQASLRDLHQVSPEMRERYANMGATQTNRPRNTRSYQDASPTAAPARARNRAASGNEWREPSVDPIGGSNLRGNRRGAAAAPALQVSTPMIIGLVAVVILLVAVIVLAMNRCSEGSAAAPEQGTQTEQSTESAAVGSDASGSTAASDSTAASASDAGNAGSASASTASTQAAETNVDRAALTAIVDEDVADKLINRAMTSDNAKWIAQNPAKFAMDGENVQRKLLKLAADEPAAQQYVRNFPDKYPMDTPQSGKMNTVATGKGIPRFYQWDEIWGYTVYSGTAFGLTGCCPTCLAMVYQGLTQKTDLTPYEMGELAVRDGYASEYDGTYANFLVDEAEALGLYVKEIDVTEKALKSAMQDGMVIIANFAPGLFTEYGHYVVITGMQQDGSLIMNDPYSEERSNQSWDVSTIVQESQGLYAYTL